MNLENYYHFCTSLAYRAGQITLGYFNTGIRPDFKPDDTPVTAADRAAETFIRAEIEKAYPTHAILGEEFGETTANGSAFRWIIDPIDGTKSFMRGVPLYAVLIGLEVEGQIKVGAAYYPGTSEMLAAYEGGGTWWNGRRAHVSDVDDLSQAYVCFTNVRNMAKHNREREWQAINEKAFSSRGWSDAYGYLLVATGRAEVMLDPIMADWDCGPFPVILKEAGGYFGNWSGQVGHTHKEAMATNAKLFPIVSKLFQDARA